LSFTRHADGSLSLRAELDAVGGERVQAAVESIVQANRPQGDLRNRSQQQADALVQLADNALAAGNLPVLRTVKPHVVVTVGIDDLVDPHPGHGAARTGFGGQISAARARMLACDGGVTRIVFGPDRQVLDMGREQRLFPRHIRRALDVRDQECVFAGCHAPTWWCDAHSAGPRGPRRACESWGGAGPFTHQGPPRLPHRTTSRRPMAHLPPRRHRDPHAGAITRNRLNAARRLALPECRAQEVTCHDVSTGPVP
jgi:hypothetical protein